VTDEVFLAEEVCLSCYASIRVRRDKTVRKDPRVVACELRINDFASEEFYRWCNNSSEPAI
jgi:hypothetical protein